VTATLIIFVCLVGGDAGDCHDEQMAEPVAAIACVAFGEQLAADWLASHPAYRMVGWKCDIGSAGIAI